ncbi:MAG: DoxX family protein [Chloroflexota bacterium]
MDTVIPVIQVLLALLFALTGVLKLTQPYAKFVKMPAQTWANDFKPEHIRLIGVLEVVAAAAMIISLLSPSLMMLAPLAGVGMALIMSGAIVTHLRRTEYPNIVGNLIWVGLGLFVAYSRLVGFAV